MEYTPGNLLIPGKDSTETSVFARVSSEQAGWQYLNLVALHLDRGGTFEITIDDYEYLAVVLGGQCRITTNRGEFDVVGRRRDVFDGMPHAVYLPRQTEFAIEALTDDCEIVSCWAPTTRDYPIRLLQPDDIRSEVVGGGSASHQINWLLRPDAPSHRLMAYEMYTPSGNWAPYPPHKHDTHRTIGSTVMEAALEEVNLYKFNRPGGFALQRIYTEDGSIDAAVSPISNDLVIIPRGYHTLASAHGFTTYTLHFLAGSAHDLHQTEDPDYTWVRRSWHMTDARLPVVDHGMEPLKPRPINDDDDA